jgi:hypothetical protein
MFRCDVQAGCFDRAGHAGGDLVVEAHLDVAAFVEHLVGARAGCCRAERRAVAHELVREIGICEGLRLVVAVLHAAAGRLRSRCRRVARGWRTRAGRARSRRRGRCGRSALFVGIGQKSVLRAVAADVVRVFGDQVRDKSLPVPRKEPLTIHRATLSQPTSLAGPPRLPAGSRRGWVRRRRGSRGPPVRPRTLAMYRAERARRPTS